MFVSLGEAGEVPAPNRGVTKRGTPVKEPLARLVARTRPISSSESQLLPVLPPLAPLLPDGGLRRGGTLSVGPAPAAMRPGGASGRVPGDCGEVMLSLALAAAASAAGSWCATVGLPDLGAGAVTGLGIDLARLATVPHPGPLWAEVTAALLCGMDLVVLSPPFPPRPAMARRLAAKARERRSVLIVVPGRPGWPECPDVHLSVGSPQWEGAGRGEGYLRQRSLTVTAIGRRAAARPRARQLWLPSATGTVAEAGAPAKLGTVAEAGAPAKLGTVAEAGAPGTTGTVAEAGAPAKTGA